MTSADMLTARCRIDACSYQARIPPTGPEREARITAHTERVQMELEHEQNE